MATSSPQIAPSLNAGDWRTYLNSRMAILLVMGFSSGLPYFTLINLIQAWLSKADIDIKALGLFTLVMFPYPWKFIWSPLMDRFHFGALGRRRGWMAFTQVCLFALIGGMGMLDPRTEFSLVIVCAIGLSFFSASQDIVVDAYTREILQDNEQGLGAAVKVNAYKVAGLVPGSLALILAQYLQDWQVVFWVTAAFMLPGLLCTLLAREPKEYGEPPKNLEDAVVAPFKEFIQRSGWKHAMLVLAFIFLYRIGDSMAATLATKFFIDLGFNLGQIGVVAKMTLFWGSIAGGIVGGIWMIKLGINRALWIFGVPQALSILGFAVLARVGPDPVVLGVVLAFEAFGVGLGTAAFVAFIARSTDRRYTATQFALFTSLAAVPRTFTTALIGYMVAATGWFNFFIICFLLAIPGMLLLFKVAPWNAVELAPNGETS